MKYEKTLNIIYSNEFIMNELKSFFYEVIEEHMPKVEGQDNQQLGEQYRAHHQAKQIISDAFVQLNSYTKAQGTAKEVRYT